MPNSRSRLESLPMEVLQTILSHLPSTSLLPTRAVSRHLHTLASSNTLWRPLVLSLCASFVGLLDVHRISACLWSFSLLPSGWFRAYLSLQQTARAPWLHRDEDLYDQCFLLYFTGTMRLKARVQDAVILFSRERESVALEGIPLITRRWSVHDGYMQVPGYPPMMPSRDPKTWCRMMHHVTVALYSDAPEFIDALLSLNQEILHEAVSAHLLSSSEAAEKQGALQKAKEALLSTARDAVVTRLKEKQQMVQAAEESENEEEEDDEDDDDEEWEEEEESECVGRDCLY